jgi:hypothetical protein
VFCLVVPYLYGRSCIYVGRTSTLVVRYLFLLVSMIYVPPMIASLAHLRSPKINNLDNLPLREVVFTTTTTSSFTSEASSQNLIALTLAVRLASKRNHSLQRNIYAHHLHHLLLRVRLITSQQNESLRSLGCRS